VALKGRFVVVLKAPVKGVFRLLFWFKDAKMEKYKLSSAVKNRLLLGADGDLYLCG
jgi:hypothetical protein